MLETGLYNMDCMDGMKMFPDKFFDLAIVDPPYGNAANANKSGLVGGN
jgi:site-specific DNA-methyltransferase (adenine-specific)